MQGYSAIGLSGCVGCVIRNNHVPHSGGDALNFNSGEYIITENLARLFSTLEYPFVWRKAVLNGYY